MAGVVPPEIITDMIIVNWTKKRAVSKVGCSLFHKFDPT